MRRLIVRIKKDDMSDPEQFEVPGDQPVKELTANLVKALGLPLRDKNNLPREYWLVNETGGLIPDKASLNESGVTNNMLIVIETGISRPVELSAPRASGGTDRADRSRFDSPTRQETGKPDSGPVKSFRPITPPPSSARDRGSNLPPDWKKVDSSNNE